jgi:hypothetical protein
MELPFFAGLRLGHESLAEEWHLYRTPAEPLCHSYVKAKRGALVMRTKLTFLALAYLIVSGLLLSTSYHSAGPITTPKTDRIAGSTFLIERFAG